VSGGLRLRARLLLAFVLVAVPPVAVLAALAGARVARAFETSANARLSSALDTTEKRIALLRARADASLAAIATGELPTTAPEADERTLAETLGARHDLACLEIVDGEGRVVSSRHWPAGFGLPDHDGGFPGNENFRVEQAAAGYGATPRLAVVATHAADLRHRRVNVRGGAFLDGDVIADLALAAQADVALYDAVRHRWTAPAGSPLGGWSPGDLDSLAAGEVALSGSAYRWAARPLCPSLFVVAAVPRSDLDRALGAVRRDTLTAGAVALAAALGAALWLSQRFSGPIRELARGAERVAGGDLGGSVAVATSDEIGDLARSFNAMTADLRASRERLVQAERVAAWREMARRLAHELKNPIFPIQVSLDTLGRALERDPQGFAKLFREASATILEELAALRRIVDEFSEFARMPQPRLAPTDLNAVVGQAMAVQRARAGKLKVEVTLADGAFAVTADRDLLARAIGNLLANALDAMPEGGALRVRTRALEGMALIEVEDTGPGMSEEQRARLFTPYYTTKPGGTGLGLAIVQGIVADHGGRIEVRSAPGKGTTFTIAIPSRA
jgi:two-component system nitrogen regulation sensor histidine kinase NtrY